MKHKRTDKETVLQNIEGLLNSAAPSFFEEGKQWYWEANEFAKTLGLKYDLPLWKTSALISALSPMKEWNLNKRLTEEFILGKRDIHFGLQVNKCLAIMELNSWSSNLVDSILVGKKTTSFYHNILEPDNPNWTTIDTHIVNSLLWQGANITPQRYDILESCIKSYSREIDLIPCQTQATIWLCHKHSKKVA